MPERILVLCDLDGTLYERGVLVPGAAAAITALRERATVRFLTNTDSTATAALADRLQQLGLTVSEDEVFTPVVAARSRLRSCRSAVVLANEAVREELAADFETVTSRRAADAVIVGDARDVLDYAALDVAFHALRSGAILIALQRGKYFRAADGEHIDTGAVVAALEYAAEVAAETLGKPTKAFAQLAVDSAGGRDAYDRIVVIGDDRSTDILMAQQSGLDSIHVLTGKAADQAGRTDMPEADSTAVSIVEAAQLVVGAGR
ncbi:HAD-IIA family hydrolase [Curtobacterium sp. VKM Ac-1376]|uniref:HAD-IIA family hydrolase n=1 Tax=Curtobacterium sp. VKM Ac-1376 TaxID=123312 RepID=UPI00188B06ED|nr:HAD-IIA family hydrolase [Curtobacterium sp. VKM Ac-1376]MBF4615498.1 HAD-IIA family hydrolase [Curtobacterium sp. VKM Ac-1376]